MRLYELGLVLCTIFYGENKSTIPMVIILTMVAYPYIFKNTNRITKLTKF